MKNKKSLFKKAIGLSMAFIMTIGAAGCNSGSDKGNEGGSAAGLQAGDKNLAKQFVFKESGLDISFLGKPDNVNVSVAKTIGDKIYLLASVVGDENNSAQFRLGVVDKDGKNGSSIELTVPGEKPSSNYGYGYGKKEDGDIEDVAIGDGEEINEEIDIENGVNVGVGFEDEFYEGEYIPEDYEYSGFGVSTLTKDAGVLSIFEKNKATTDDNGNYVSEMSISLCSWDSAGNFKWRTTLAEESGDGWLYVNKVIPVVDGGAIVYLDGSQMRKVIVDGDGNIKSNETSNDQNGFYENLIAREDGTFYVTSYDDDWTKMYISTYDASTNTYSEKQLLPSESGLSMAYEIYAGKDDKLVFTTNSGVFEYKIGDAECKQVMDFMNSDIMINDMRNISFIDDSSFFCTYSLNEEYTMKCGIFTKVNPEDIPDREVIVIATEWAEYELKSRAYDYNKNNDKYRIVITEYDKYNTPEDYTAGQTKLTNDILSGNVPDIISFGYSMAPDKFAEKGLLEDVDALIANDPELSNNEYMKNVFDAYRNNGKLTTIIPSFTIETLIAKKSLVGDKKSWTMDEMQNVLKGLEKGALMLGETTRENFLYYAMLYGIHDFLDLDSGKCSFDSKQFVDILNYAKTLPENLDNLYADEDWWMNYQSQYRDNRSLAMHLYISEFSYIKYQINGYMGEDVAYIGFPSEGGKGSVINANNMYAITTKSKNKEAAWEFLRYYLTAEYQNKVEYGLPILKSALIEKSADATKKSYYENDMTGEREEYDDYITINGEDILVPVMSQKQVDELLDFIESVNLRSYYNQDIQKIVEEETSAFFAGKKSAEEVAKIIQSRAQIYVNENR